MAVMYSAPDAAPLNNVTLKAEVPSDLAGKRLDQIAAQLFPDFSRSRLQQWIRQGELTVNGSQRRPRDLLSAGDQLAVSAQLMAVDSWQSQDMALDILFEDEQLLVLNKAAATVVHPAAGHQAGTLLNGLLHHCPSLATVPRAGIVHRLDKDTTGLMVVAKTLSSHTALVRQLQQRAVSREYQAVVVGVMTGGGTVDVPLGRHPVQRKKRAVVANGQEAVSHYRVQKRFRAHSHIWVKLQTGRTHQIRVHMAHIRHPLVGDPLYGGRLRIPAGISPALKESLRSFSRQALHAARLVLAHPLTGAKLSFESELPADMRTLLAEIGADAEEAEQS